MKRKVYPRIIGIAGHVGSGKTMLARHFQREHGYTLYDCSDSLCLLYEELHGWVTNELPGTLAWREAWSEHKRNKDVRAALQKMGHWTATHFGPAALLYPAFVHADIKGPVVIAGIRRMAEAAAILEHPAGLMLGIERPGYRAINDHATESEVDEVLATLGEVTGGACVCMNDEGPEDVTLWAEDILVEYSAAAGDCVGCE